ncbi:MAG TPA: tail fiber protein [Rhodocyclaceae bacterium]
MSDAFIGEIRAFTYTFPPLDWADCDGAGLSAGQFSALYAVIGNLYGGNQTTFNVPDLQGRVPVGVGRAATGGTVTHVLAETGGTLSETIDANKMASHTHAMQRVSNSQAKDYKPSVQDSPGSNIIDNSVAPAVSYKAMVPNIAPDTTLHPQALSAVGGGQPHENRMPYQAVRFCICTAGVFPVRG